MAGDTRGPDSMGGRVTQSIGRHRLAAVDRWGAARGFTRAAAIRVLIDLGLDTCPTRYADRPRHAEIAHRRAHLIRELAEIDAELGEASAVARATFELYAYLRTDLRLRQQRPPE